MLRLSTLFMFILVSVFPSLQLLSLPSQVLIIRHGEKPLKGNELSERGFERSGALTFYFQKDAFVLDFGLPSAIFAARPKNSKSSKRAIQTITPFAEARNISINTSFKLDQFQDLAKEIINNPEYEGKTVLISWVHRYMDHLVASLGVDPIPPPYPGNRYDLVYKITYNNGKSGSAEFSIGLQKLMFDDRATLPKRFSPSFYLAK